MSLELNNCTHHRQKLRSRPLDSRQNNCHQHTRPQPPSPPPPQSPTKQQQQLHCRMAPREPEELCGSQQAPRWRTIEEISTRRRAGRSLSSLAGNGAKLASRPFKGRRLNKVSRGAGTFPRLGGVVVVSPLPACFEASATAEISRRSVGRLDKKLIVLGGVRSAAIICMLAAIICEPTKYEVCKCAGVSLCAHATMTIRENFHTPGGRATAVACQAVGLDSGRL
jgi:hypothetical protein